MLEILTATDVAVHHLLLHMAVWSTLISLSGMLPLCAILPLLTATKPINVSNR